MNILGTSTLAPSAFGHDASVAILDDDPNKINKNFETILETVSKEKPLNQKGDFILSAFLSSTMGVSYKIKLKNL